MSPGQAARAGASLHTGAGPARTRRFDLRAALGRAVGDWPIWLHRMGLGRLVGRDYAVVETVGRRSGRRRFAAVMVLREDPTSGELFVVAGDPATNWYRNACVAPATAIWIGRDRFQPVQRVLAAEEIAELLLDVRRERPRQARVQCAFFGWPWRASSGEIRELAATLGGIAFRPAGGR